MSTQGHEVVFKTAALIALRQQTTAQAITAGVNALTRMSLPALAAFDRAVRPEGDAAPLKAVLLGVCRSKADVARLLTRAGSAGSA
jgi:hypothetical protein